MVVLKRALCVAGVPEKKRKKLVRSLWLQRPVKNVYLITAPTNKDNYLEFFRGDQLRFRAYKRRRIPVYGLAGNEEDAIYLASCMVLEAYAATGEFRVTEYLERRAGGKAGGGG